MRAARRVLAPLRDRNFALLWTGMTVSLLGDGVLLVALAWQVYELSNAPTALAAVGVAMTIPHVAFLLLGGVASDRLDRRVLMIVADVARAAAVGVMGLLAATGDLRLWHVFPLIAVYGAATAFFGPAFDAFVPDVVAADELPQANAIDQFVRPLALRLAGPALGGFVIAAGGGTAAAFLFDACTFIVSMACLTRVRPQILTHDTAGRESGSMIGEVAEGFRFVRHNVWLWGTLLAAACAYLLFMGPVEVLLPYIVKNDLHAGGGSLGIIFAVGGVGAILASLAMAAVGTPRRNITLVYLTWTGSTLVLAGYGIVHAPWQAMVISFLFNGLESAGTVVWLTTKQRLVPRHLLGRVSSFDWFISTGLVPLSFAITAPVAAAIGARDTFVLAGVLGAGVTLAFLFLPGVRDAEGRRPDATAPDPEPAQRLAA